MTEVEVAWFAGLFEGEGSLSKGAPREYHWRMTIRMTDEDVIRRIQSIFGGSVYAEKYRNKKKPTHKDGWLWQVTRRDLVKPIVEAIYPYMGQRRRAKMDQCLADYAIAPQCRRGEATRKNWLDPEYRARQCAERKKRWEDPEYRAKVVNNLRPRQTAVANTAGA